MTSGSGGVLNLSTELSSGRWTNFLERYGENLEPLSRVEVRQDAIGLITEGPFAWVVDRSGVAAYGAQSPQSVRRVSFPVPHGMRVGALAVFEGDFIVAMEHAQGDTPPGPGMLMRLDANGSVRWMANLPLSKDAFPSRNSRGDAWFCGRYIHAGRLSISRDAVLVIFTNPRVNIGRGYVVALDRGALRYSALSDAIGDGTPLAGGEFLVGYGAYGHGQTVHYGAPGNIIDKWPTRGHCVVRDGDMYVLEFGGDLVRLGADGHVFYGPWLGCHTSRPWLRDDGTLFFARQGTMCAAQGLSIIDRLEMIDGDKGEDCSSSDIVKGDGCLYVRVARKSTSESHLVRIDL